MRKHLFFSISLIVFLISTYLFSFADDNNGRIGSSSVTPVLKLNIIYGDTPFVRLEQDDTLGWDYQIWDIGSNESNFFIRDITNSYKLPFRIQAGAPTNSLTVDSGGKVAIGTSNPTYYFEINRTGLNPVMAMIRTDGATTFINAGATFGNFGTKTNHEFRLSTNNIVRATFNTDNSVTMANGASLTAGGVWTNASSRELKENIEEISANEAVKTVAMLNPVKYNYKNEKNEKYVGFISEDVPDLVATKDKKSLSPMDIIAVLTKVVQEQQKTIDEQKSDINQNKKQIEELTIKINSFISSK